MILPSLAATAQTRLSGLFTGGTFCACLPAGATASKASGQSACCREASEEVHVVPGQSQFLFPASKPQFRSPAGSGPTSPPFPARTGLHSCLSACWSENGVFYHSDRTRVVQACWPARRHWASQTSSPRPRKQPLGVQLIDPGPVIFWTSKM